MTKKEALAAYKEELKNICSSYDSLISFISFCAKFNKKSYSGMNKAIVRHYYPNCVAINTMKQWNEAGYSVMKGQKPLTLLAPNFKKRKKVDKDTGVELDEEEQYLSGFSCFFVFDSTQVKDKDGNPFMENYEEDPLFEIDDDLNNAIVSIGGRLDYQEAYRNLNSIVSKDLKGSIAEFILTQQLCVPNEEAMANVKYHMENKQEDDIKKALKEGQYLAKDLYKKLEGYAFN